MPSRHKCKDPAKVKRKGWKKLGSGSSGTAYIDTATNTVVKVACKPLDNENVAMYLAAKCQPPIMPQGLGTWSEEGKFFLRMNRVLGPAVTAAEFRQEETQLQIISVLQQLTQVGVDAGDHNLPNWMWETPEKKRIIRIDAVVTSRAGDRGWQLLAANLAFLDKYDALGITPVPQQLYLAQLAADLMARRTDLFEWHVQHTYAKKHGERKHVFVTRQNKRIQQLLEETDYQTLQREFVLESVRGREAEVDAWIQRLSGGALQGIQQAMEAANEAFGEREEQTADRGDRTMALGKREAAFAKREQDPDWVYEKLVDCDDYLVEGRGGSAERTKPTFVIVTDPNKRALSGEGGAPVGIPVAEVQGRSWCFAAFRKLQELGVLGGEGEGVGEGYGAVKGRVWLFQSPRMNVLHFVQMGGKGWPRQEVPAYPSDPVWEEVRDAV